MEEIKNLTAEEITQLLKDGGVKDTTIQGLNFVRSEVPTSGTFAYVEVVTAEIPGANGVQTVKYPALVIIDQDKNKVGQVAFSRLFAGECEPLVEGDFSKGVKTFQINKADSVHKGKWMPTTKRLNDFRKYGSSDTQIISNLIGKQYQAEIKADCVVPDLNDLKHIQDTEAKAKKATVLKDLHLFRVTA